MASKKKAEDTETAAQEVKAFAKSLLKDIHEKGRTQEDEPEPVFKTRVKIQAVTVAVEILRFLDGEIDVRQDKSEVVSVYRHEISVVPGSANVSKVRAILTRGDFGRAEDGREVLCGDNWSMTSNGLILSLRFSGRHPADAAGQISEPAQPTLDMAAEGGAGATNFMNWMKKIEKCHEDAEHAAHRHSEFTYEDRKLERERETAVKEEREERGRPQRLWNAVKEGKIKAATEVLERPFVRTTPPKPLVSLADDAGWTLLHWSAFKNHRDMCMLLLRYNADLLIRDSIGNTPFQLACSSGADDTVTLLMERMKKHDAGWAFNTGNQLGSTALVDATSNGHNMLAKKLLKDNCDWFPHDSKPGHDVSHQHQSKDANRPG